MKIYFIHNGVVGLAYKFLKYIMQENQYLPARRFLPRHIFTNIYSYVYRVGIYTYVYVQVYICIGYMWNIEEL